MNVATLARADKEQLLAALEERARRAEMRRVVVERDAIIERCQSLHAFIEEFWRVLEPARPFVSGWAIEGMCEHLEAVTRGEILRLLTTVPPGMMKSLMLVFWTAWEWGPKGRPFTQVLGTSYNQDNVLRDNMKLRDLVTSEKYQALWPVQLRSDANATSRFINTDSGFSWARPFGSMTGGRANRVKIDDPHSIKIAESDVQRRETVKLFREQITDRLNDVVRDAIVIIMQRVHYDDVAAAAIEMGNYVHLDLPMRFITGERCATPLLTDPRRDEGELLFPERFPENEMVQMEADKGDYAWSSQYQQRPTPRRAGFIKADMIEIVDAAPATVTAWARGWDLADSLKGDFTAGALIGKMADGRFVIADMARDRALSDERDALIRAAASRDKAAHGNAVRISLPKEPAAAGQTLARHHVRMLAGYNVRTSPEGGSKETRADPLASQINVGNVLMLKGEWNKPLLDEMRMFPAGRYDDQVDACSRAFAELVFGVSNAIIAAPVVATSARPSPGG